MSQPTSTGARSCPHCGADQLPGSAFCDSCGARQPVAAGPAGTVPTFHLPPPGASPPAPATSPPPAWLVQDWPFALVVALGSLLALALVCLLYGLGLGALGAGGDGLVPGLVVGAVLPFAAYGGEVAVLAGDDESDVALLLDTLPLLLTAVAAALTYGLLRAGARRLAAVPARATAFVLKALGLQALVLLVAGSFASVGEADEIGSDGFGAYTAVGQGRATGIALLVGLLVGILALQRSGVRWLPEFPGRLTATRLLLAARAGAVAWLALAALLGLVSAVGTGIALEGARERGALAAATPLLLSGFGTTSAAVAHGGAAGYSDSLRSFDDDELLSVLETDDESVSLLDYAVPLTDREDTAPLYAFASLLAPLAALVGGTLLLLRRASPPTEGWALGLACVLGLGYAVTSWLVSLLAPLHVLAEASSLDGLLFLVLTPSAGSALGLPLLWAAVLTPLTGYAYARSQRLPGSIFTTAAEPQPGG